MSSADAPTRRGLGRGLEVLVGGGGTSELLELPIDAIRPNPRQPRKRFEPESTSGLAASIRHQGVLQPVVVRPRAEGGYELIAGERRWRAARIAGLTEVPVVVRDVPDQAALAMSLIENIQREDLNPLEEAQGVQRLVSEFKLTHQEAADAIGRSRAATTNLLRLLNLPQPVQQLVFDGQLDMGHARALLALDGELQVATARKVAARGLSVRETEQLVNDLLHPKARMPRPKARSGRDIQRLEEEVSEKLGTTVEIKSGKKGSGRLVVHYMSYEHLDDLLAKLTR